MRIWNCVVLVGFVGLGACARRQPAPAAQRDAMPVDTVKLSTMMQTLSARPGFTDQFLADLAGGGNKAALPLTPELRHDLRELILGRRWQGLDRFPGWTMDRLNPVVAGVQEIVTINAPPPGPEKILAEYVDLGAYPLTRGGTVDLDKPAAGPGFEPSEEVTPLLDGVSSGDGPDPTLAPLHAESQRLADVLNRLSLNRLDWAGVAVAPLRAELAGQTVTSPEDLVRVLKDTGHRVEVDDSRYFANFGSFNWQRPDGSYEVEMPFWLDAQIAVPGTKRTLKVPVSHAEYEWRIWSETAAGPKLLAAVSFWFGIDGKAEFRTMDQTEQRWVMGRHAHGYTGTDAVEVTRLAGRLATAYARLHLEHPALPFGGYYTLGVCQDVVAAIELKMTGTTTLFPNTADNAYFTDPHDAEVNALIRRLPKDGHGRGPDVARVFGSLPLEANDEALAKVTIPGLAPDLIAVNDAWRDGELDHPERRWLGLLAAFLLVLAVVVFAALGWRRRRRIRAGSQVSPFRGR